MGHGMSNTPHDPTPGTQPPPWTGLAWAVGACALVTLLAWPLSQWLHLVNTVLLYLLMVALVANRLGRAPAVLAAVLSVAAFDFCFVPPRGSFAVHDGEFIVTFVVMLAVALIISHLAEGLRRQARQAQDQVSQTQAMYQLASTLAGALSADQVQAATQVFAQAQWPGTHARLAILTPDAQGQLQPVLQGTDHTPDAPQALWPANLMRAAQAVYLSGHPQESSQLDLDGHLALLHPLDGATRRRGVLLIALPPHAPVDLPQTRELAPALAALVVAAVERLHFVDVAHDTQLAMSNERLRSSILSALSHDIRTPLTGLYGTADALLLTQPPLSSAARDMATALRDQALRLNHLVIKLLDMAQLQSGHVALRREWQPLEEVIGASIQSLGPALARHPVHVDLAADLPLVHIDAVLFERVLANLLDNACKYATPGSTLQMAARPAPSPGATNHQTHWTLTLDNDGPGFPPDRIDAVFGLFERGVHESSVPGMGLGLAICKAIVEAHGGQIRAHNTARGAQVSITVPQGQPPAIDLEATP